MDSLFKTKHLKINIKLVFFLLPVYLLENDRQKC